MKPKPLTFLDFARITLTESIADKESKDFLINEATQFEILHLLIFEKFPKIRESETGKKIIMSLLGDYVSENKEVFETFIGPTAVASFISEAEDNGASKEVMKALISAKKSSERSKSLEKLKSLKKPLLGAGSLAVAALAGYAAYKIYQNYYSRVSRPCLRSKDKVDCIKKARISALKAQATTLKSSLAACRKTSNPEKCRSSINKKLSYVESRITGYMKK